VRELVFEVKRVLTMTLNELISRCKCGVFVTVNEHRDYYQSAADALIERDGYECPPRIDPAVRAEMIRLNTVVRLQFYPDTPIGSYEIYHYDLDAALAEAEACFS
jgi:hypothetical protein